MNKIIILIGLICGMLAGFLVYTKLETSENAMIPTSYVTLAKPPSGAKTLRAGQLVEGGYLGSIEIPNSGDIFGLDAQLIKDTPNNRAWLEGKRLNATIPMGRVLTFNLFEDIEIDRLDQTVPVGKRAVSINVNTENSLNNRVVPGNRVDLMGVLESSNAEAVVILEDVRVIGVGDSLSFDALQSSRKSTYSTITIEVTVEEAARLASARKRLEGSLILLLRNQCDTEIPNASCG